MYFFYLLALLPLVIGGMLWALSKKVVWQEWAISFGLSLLTAVIMHGIAYYGQTSDIQTLSGQIEKAIYYPEYVEEYHYTTTHKVGKSSITVVHTAYRTHNQYWQAYSNIDTSYLISKEKFEEMRLNFNNFNTENGNRVGFYSGDNNIYTSYNKTGYIYPITKVTSWENKLKAAPTTFSFAPVSKSAPVYDWPENPDPWASNRLIGQNINISVLEWDRMNARLGPSKKVNAILIGFGNKLEEVAELQRAKFLGGKKNDIILTFGMNNGKVTWSKVFGWSDAEIVKSNLASILLENPIDNKIISLIEQEIKKNYKIKDWTKFDYITVEPRPVHYIVAVIITFISQIIFWIVAYCNDITKEDFYSLNRYKRNKFYD